jgi:hypothetical protein
MAITLEELKVLITSETSGLKTELDKVKTELSRTNKDVTKSTTGIKTALTKLGVVIGAVFAVKKIIDFGSAAHRLYNYQHGQEAKLTAIMRQRMNATDGMIRSIKALTMAQQELGVIGDEVQLAGAQQLATFLVTTDSLRTLIPAMNNLAAQQKGVNATGEDLVNIGNMMGKVMQGQVGALTRVGISFTEAEERVLKYGNEQERAAMLAQVIRNNVGDMNEALRNTPAGQIKALRNTLGDVKEEIGKGITPVVQRLLPWLNAIAARLMQAAQYFSAFMQAFFGKKVAQNEQALNSLGGAASAAGKKIEEAGKKARKGLAGFDEINIIGSNIQPTSGTPDIGGAFMQSLELPDLDTEEVPAKVQAMVDRIKNTLGGLQRSTKNITSSIGRHFAGVPGAIKPMGDALRAHWENTLIPMGKFIIGDFIAPIASAWSNQFLPVIGPLTSRVLKELGDLLGWVAGLINRLWLDVTKPLLEQFRMVAIDVIQIVAQVWQDYGQTIVNNLFEAMAKLRGIVNQVLDFVLPLVLYLLETVTGLWDSHLKGMVRELGNFIGKLVSGALEIYNKVILPLISWLIDVLAPGFTDTFKLVTSVLSSVIGAVSDVVKGILRALGGLIDFIVGVFTGDWRRAWRGVTDFFGGIWDGLVGIVKGVINIIIDAVNSMIRGLNRISFDVPGWVAKLTGAKAGKWGINIPLIPKLAEGGILSAGQLFIAREAGPELVGGFGGKTGVMNNEQIVQAVSQGVYRAMLAALGQTKSDGNGNLILQIYLGGSLILEELIDEVKRRNIRAGKQVIHVG